jgi:urease subunit gamma/beta
MKLTEHEQERLLVFLAAELARRRRSAGLKLNHPEAVAVIVDEVMEAARAGATFDEVERLGYTILAEDEVLPGVADMIDALQIEPLFDDGTHLVTLYHPVRNAARVTKPEVVPGEIIHGDGELEAESGPTVRIDVANVGDRAIQVTSHYHFFETNKHLRFDRLAAWGTRPDIPVGHAIRFEPGETRTVRLRPIAGRRVVRGQQGFVDGHLDSPVTRERAIERARAAGFLTEDTEP